MVRMRIVLKADDGLTRRRTVTPMPSARSLQPYNDKPLLLEDGQPTDIARNTWTQLGHRIEH